MTRISAHMG